ncbi:nitroreductase [Polynucleobacter sp. AP-Nickl1-40-C4]|uniref:nitroreductase family protein n=1 Tax=Polynucleobacter sp. AP-Nickl1-40-C4 TaxID=3108275 RepID=UPI002B22FA80|nr:nitroreductase [Polynucleobacter sp. AP-Nickl1-40-C4]MEA9567541.1 nitroreductase [Polynucleobacter sp. AP-Nickl1-40-C4]
MASDNLDSLGGFAHALIHSRQHVSPKRLIAPGPNLSQKLEILNAAGAAPDHGKVTPWHFYEVSPESRNLLGDLFADALIARDPSATPTQIDEAKQKAFRGPLLLLATAKLNNELDNIPEQEKLISAGCAIQNILLMANALGFGSGLSSGKALYSQKMRELFLFKDKEEPLCFITIGTISAHKPNKQRPDANSYSSVF